MTPYELDALKLKQEPSNELESILNTLNARVKAKHDDQEREKRKDLTPPRVSHGVIALQEKWDERYFHDSNMR